MNKRITLLWLFEQSDKQDFWIVLKVQGETEKCLFFPLFCLRSLNSTGDPSPQALPQLKGYRFGGVKLCSGTHFFLSALPLFPNLSLEYKSVALKVKESPFFVVPRWTHMLVQYHSKIGVNFFMSILTIRTVVI